MKRHELRMQIKYRYDVSESKHARALNPAVTHLQN